MTTIRPKNWLDALAQRDILYINRKHSSSLHQPSDWIYVSPKSSWRERNGGLNRRCCRAASLQLLSMQHLVGGDARDLFCLGIRRRQGRVRPKEATQETCAAEIRSEQSRGVRCHSQANSADTDSAFVCLSALHSRFLHGFTRLAETEDNRVCGVPQ